MFNFFTSKKDNEKQKIEYFENVKSASLFLDKSILTISSAFLWFLLSQFENLYEIKSQLLNIIYLHISIISIWFTIFFVLISYILSIKQAKIWYDILEKNIPYDKWIITFNNYDLFIDLFRIIYFVTFIIPIILTVLFYISNF